MERRLSTLDSDSSELRNFHYLCQNEATVDAHGYVSHICPVDAPQGVLSDTGDTYMLGPLFVARSTERAMRRPQNVERAMVTAPRFSFIYYGRRCHAANRLHYDITSLDESWI